MRNRSVESEVADAVGALFRRWPTLVGFSVAETPAADLVVSDLETDPWPGHSPELFGEVTDALLELMDDEPAVREWLAGRTFARTFH